MEQDETKIVKKGKILWIVLGFLGVFLPVFAGFRYTVWPCVTANKSKSVLGFYLFICFCLLLIAGYFALCILKPAFLKSEKRMVMGLVFCLGMVYFFSFPPMSAPDESAHFAQSYYYSNILLGKGEYNKSTANGMYPGMRDIDVSFLLHTRPGIDDLQKYIDGLTVFGTGTMVEQSSVKALGGVFWSYLPQTIGLSIGRILHLGPVWIFFLGRLFNFLFFLLCFYYAFTWMPVGKQVLGIIACFPMTLHLVSSLNYDACILGLSFLFVAKILELTFQKETVSNKDLCILTIVMMLLAPIKVIYVMLSFLCFMIPWEKFGNKKQYVKKAAIMAVCVLGAFLLVNIPRLIPYLLETNLDLDYVGEGAKCYTLKELLASPLLVFSLMANTLRVYGSEHFLRMAGQRLGWLEIDIPIIIILLFYALLFWSALRTNKECKQYKYSAYAGKWSLFVILSVIILAYFSMLTAWTPAGSTVIEGVQGRYFLPILPLAAFFIRNLPIEKNSEEQSATVYFFVVLLHLWTLAASMETMINRLGFDIISGNIVR